MTRWRTLLLGSAIAAVIGGSATGDPAQSDRNPDWVSRPTRESLLAVWPSDQLASEHGGHATLSCTVTVQGVLRACRVAEETPPGAGFGAAALALVPQLFFRPAMHNGQLIEATVRIPITWPRLPHQIIGPLPEEPLPPLVSRPPWIRAPTFAELAAAAPLRARGGDTPGHVVLGCGFHADGTLSSCRVATEAPLGQGYGDAALRLAGHFQMRNAPLPPHFSLMTATVMVPITFPAGVTTGSPPVIGHPRWIAAPTGEQAFAAYPAAALAAGTSGRGVAACTVDEHGALTHCAVEAETPPGQGFGAAVVSLTPRFQMTLWTEEGLPTAGAQVRIPITFHPPEPDPPVPAATTPQAAR